MRAARVAERVASEAERFYLRADAGLRYVPFACRPAVRATRWLGVAVLRELRPGDPSSFGRPRRLAAARVVAIAARAVYAGRGEHGDRALSPMDEAKWLVDAAAR